MAARYIVPAIALVGSVVGMSRDESGRDWKTELTSIAQTGLCNGSLTILSQSDASSISACTTYVGDITISPNATGDISISGLRGLNGDLVCKDAVGLTSLSTDQLNTISGTFDLEGLTIMSTLSMSALTAVNSINWITLPALQQLAFPMGVSRANNVYISDTALTTLSGIELTAVSTININNNRYLKTVNVGPLTNVTTAISLSDNSDGLDISFPSLVSAANLTMRGVSSLSLPALNQVSGSMGLYSNDFALFSAPNLTAVGKTVAFVDNMNLNNISVPSMIYLGGGLLIQNNTQLTEIDGFNALQQIGGDINFYGTFDEVEFNSLNYVKGAATVYTSSTNSSICALFNAAHDAQHQVIRGKVDCKTGDASQNSSSSSSNSSSGSSSHNAAVVVSSSLSTSLTAVVAALAAFLFL